MKLERFEKLKKQVEKLRSSSERAKGVLEGLLSRLEEEFDCSSLEEAEDKLEALEKNQEELETAFQEKMDRFTEKYADLLGADEFDA